MEVKDNMNMNMSGEFFNGYAKSIVFVSGSFTDHMRKIENLDCKPAVAAAAGMHTVLPGYNCSRGVLARNVRLKMDINTSAGRCLFFLRPSWQGKILVNTTNL